MDDALKCIKYQHGGNWINASFCQQRGQVFPCVCIRHIGGKKLDGGSVRLNQFSDSFAQHRTDQDVGIQNDGRAAHLTLAMVAGALFLRAFLKSATMSSTSTPCADNSLSSD